jgi:hypothetical protein
MSSNVDMNQNYHQREITLSPIEVESLLEPERGQLCDAISAKYFLA